MTTAKLGALAAVFFFMPWRSWLDRFDYFVQGDRLAKTAIFLTLTAICVLGLALLPFLKSSAVRITLGILAILGFAADQLAIALSAQDLNATMIATLWREQAMIVSAASAYFWPALRVAAWILPIMFVFAWQPARPFVLRTYWATVPVGAFVGCLVVARLTTATGTEGLPAAFRVPAVTTIAALTARYPEVRDKVTEGPTSQPRYSKIVMIVDESVRGDFLGINDPSKNNTPFLSEMKNGLVNFGLAIAAHNCSAPARYILRAGLQPSDLPEPTDRALRAPTIWQFAKKAGYQTVLIDAWSEVFGVHSFMSKTERVFIDKEIPVSGSPVYLRDKRIATEVLPPLLAIGERTFVYLNKYGAHFPYRTTHPPDFPGDGVETTDNLDNRNELIASYSRALRWAVDEFFRMLLSHADLSDTLIIYTSDHGQSLLEGGYKLTHCSSSNVHPGEAIVPTFAMTDDREFGRALKAMAQQHFGKSTHFDIFPTLLLAMGYGQAWVDQHYGAESLVRMSGNPKRRFLSGDVFVPFWTGLGARWVDIK